MLQQTNECMDKTLTKDQIHDIDCIYKFDGIYMMEIPAHIDQVNK